MPLPVVLRQVEFQWFAWMASSILALAVAYTAWGLLHLSCWRALPERYRATTPGIAVGLLFVPVFNFYWSFVSLGKLASGFEAWGRDHPDRQIRPAGALAIAKAVSFIAWWTIGFLVGVAPIVAINDVVLFALYYRAIAHNANEVIAAEAAAHEARS
jgi:hypothetical protein